MGQIVKSKKKGRPSRADLARRPISPTPVTESEVRRSLRRRNVRYDIDYYEDYFYEEDDDDDEERRREKKLKLVVKLNQRSDSAEPARSRSRSSARAQHGSDEDEEEDKPLKKRNIDGVDVSESEEENNYDDEEERGRKVQARGQDTIPGTPTNRATGIPVPDKKSLELILDKLQKKDTYGVYAEPVDPEELPDYHDVIENPMDFTTVRNKLGNGSYSTLEQFEVGTYLHQILVPSTATFLGIWAFLYSGSRFITRDVPVGQCSPISVAAYASYEIASPGITGSMVPNVVECRRGDSFDNGDIVTIGFYFCCALLMFSGII